MENHKIQLSSMYGKFGDKTILLNTNVKVESPVMDEWMEHLTQEDVRRIRLVSQALGWTPERVVRTPFVTIIRELACKVIELKTERDYNGHVLEAIEKFLEDRKG